MRKETISHEHLKKYLQELETLQEDIPEEDFERLIDELKHSSLIIAGNVMGDKINVMTIETDMGEFAFLFTDTGELRKVFPDFDVEGHENSLKQYINMVSESNLDGYIINAKSECFILPEELLNLITDLPEHDFPSHDSYSSSELKSLKDSIDNESLEQFINDPSNIGRYEELFERISSSTLLTLRLSKENLIEMVEDGIISMLESGPIGYLYNECVGGDYAVAFTSEEKIAEVPTPLNRYSQIVNFSQMTNFMLIDDMDGIIINPNSDNLVLTREVLLEFSNLLERTCNDYRLNSAIFHMFPIDA